MAKVSFDIPKDVIDEAAKKKIKELERKLINAENREKRLKEKLAAFEDREDTLREVRTFVNEMVYRLDLVDDYQRC